MTTPNNQPTPPPGYRLLTPEEYDKPLPDGAKFLGLESWVSSVCEGMIPKMRNGLASDIYAIPITVPATGDTTNEKGGEQRQEILPCPFCGCEKASVDSVPNTGGNLVFYRCSNCNAKGPWSNRDDVKQQWNTRK